MKIMGMTHGEKVSKSLIGKTGESARRWKGIDAGYVAKHRWIVKHYGKSNKCENVDCVYVNPKRFEWANISGEYKREREDYMMLCSSCHRIKDKGNTCKHGHLFTKETTYITKAGWRVCRTCQKRRQKIYYGKKNN